MKVKDVSSVVEKPVPTVVRLLVGSFEGSPRLSGLSRFAVSAGSPKTGASLTERTWKVAVEEISSPLVPSETEYSKESCPLKLGLGVKVQPVVASPVTVTFALPVVMLMEPSTMERESPSMSVMPARS